MIEVKAHISTLVHRDGAVTLEVYVPRAETPALLRLIADTPTGYIVISTDKAKQDEVPF